MRPIWTTSESVADSNRVYYHYLAPKLEHSVTEDEKKIRNSNPGHTMHRSNAVNRLSGRREKETRTGLRPPRHSHTTPSWDVIKDNLEWHKISPDRPTTSNAAGLYLVRRTPLADPEERNLPATRVQGKMREDGIEIIKQRRCETVPRLRLHFAHASQYNNNIKKFRPPTPVIVKRRS